ncbi:Protein of unknown function DUF2617 [Klenkia marina]|uniref:DUF2617 domain-containing protein n=1 Tax=Klenkia marina TaxID=1960309 RepID=A0A1G4YV33_9ACTN|nr:DUF2617 family protein [Klenkia marina]SCX57270.1 Protein of unknown function DUF2617 [Klenkia marina]
MSSLQLAVPPRDVAAATLGLLLDAPAPEALATLEVPGEHGSLVLAVLGASHVVTATRGPHRLTEQVSCDAVAAGGVPLPTRTDRPGYRFTATVERLAATDLAATAAQLHEESAGRPDRICAGFPGHPAAVTALAGRSTATGWAWRTWHLYPGATAGELVTTDTDWSPA